MNTGFRSDSFRLTQPKTCNIPEVTYNWVTLSLSTRVTHQSPSFSTPPYFLSFYNTQEQLVAQQFRSFSSDAESDISIKFVRQTLQRNLKQQKLFRDKLPARVPNYHHSDKSSIRNDARTVGHCRTAQNAKNNRFWIFKIASPCVFITSI